MNLFKRAFGEFNIFHVNGHECVILYIIWPFKWDFIAFNVFFISIKNWKVVNNVVMMLQVLTEVLCEVCFVIFITRRCPLNMITRQK